MGNKSSTELKSSVKGRLHQLSISSIHLPARHEHLAKRPTSTPQLRLMDSEKSPTPLPHFSHALPPQRDQIPPSGLATPPPFSAPRADTPALLTQPPIPEVPDPSPETARPRSFIPGIKASPFAPSPFATSLPKSENSTITPGTFHARSPPTFALSPPPSSDSSASNPPIISPPTSSQSSTNFPTLFPPLPVVAPPITERHHRCYQLHQNMLFSKNKFCPVPCMVCKSEDDQGRWTCSWCSLRVCKGCRGRLREILKGEDHVVGSLKKRNTKSDRDVHGNGEEDLMLGHW